MALFSKFMSLFKSKEKRIAFIDGDQGIHGLIHAYHTYIANTNTETHFIRLRNSGGEPKGLKRLPTEVNRIYLEGFRTGKEIVDKYIAAYIQKAVTEGYTHITIVSSDYDFFDIFKMAVLVDDRASLLTFKLIVPKAEGMIKTLPHQVANIEIIKMR